MLKAKWMGLPILMMFWICLGTACADPEILSEDTDDLAEGAIAEPVPPEEEPRIELPEPGFLEEATEEAPSLLVPAVQTGESVSVADMMRRMRRTPVQLAPNFFPGYEFSEISATRRRATARFNRRAAEARLIGDNQALYEVTLLVLSRGIVHEANFMHRPCGEGYHTACDTSRDRNHAEFDGPAMYAVFRHTRATGGTLIGSIRNHMRYVTEMVPARRPRSRWITELDLEGNRPPHFPLTDANGNPLNWERDYLPRWQQVIEMSRRLLAGHDLGVCANAPLVTWGGRCEDSHGACDDDLAIRRGLVPFDCGPSSNRFWCRPGTPGCPDAALPTGSVATVPEETPVTEEVVTPSVLAP